MALSLNSNKGSKEQAWHADFRDASALPDVKAIRTNFFIAAAVVTLAISGAFQAVQQEMRIDGVASDVEKLTKSLKPQYDQNKKDVVLDGNIKADFEQLGEFVKFRAESVRASDFLDQVCHMELPDAKLSAVQLEIQVKTPNPKMPKATILVPRLKVSGVVGATNSTQFHGKFTEAVKKLPCFDALKKQPGFGEKSSMTVIPELWRQSETDSRYTNFTFVVEVEPPLPPAPAPSKTPAPAKPSN